ncbi:hypothetical protein KDJ56_18390 [Brevibacillus composti]|uniref:GNAT family N-acetyltransferase n=1 Tax=Brevibacillus composti TaxID=2796470 RepID=A0A7T5EJL8_9BACL|nr:hypothetical protein JD108_18450 [Brevibacillus composti]QUO40906.1 hypothetical protein KDJ56_18390 [Brevibacillus composti]
MDRCFFLSQRRGIGSLLLNLMICPLQARGIGEFCLDSGYKEAQKVWKKRLGEPNYVLRDYWGEGFDHLIWKRSTREVPIIL